MKLIEEMKFAFWAIYRIFKAIFTKRSLKVPRSVREQRLKTCYGCELVNFETHLFGIEAPRCGHCGCFLKLKVKLSTESCPLEEKKWNEYVNN